MQIQSNNESDDHISDLQEDEIHLKKGADSLLDQDLIASDIMLSTCSQNDASSNGKCKHSISNIIDKKNDEDEYPRDTDGHNLI